MNIDPTDFTCATTIRAHIATQAMVGILSGKIGEDIAMVPAGSGDFEQILAEASVKVADALIKRLNIDNETSNGN